MPPPTATAAWTLADHRAQHAGGLIDLAIPAAGLAEPGGDRLLGLDLRTPGDAGLVDQWVRGQDLVAVYEPPDPRRLRATAMWRAWSAENPAWELIVSAQTGRVESDAAVAVCCDLADGQLFIGGAGEPAWSACDPASLPTAGGCLLVRRGADAVLIAVHPADPHRLVVRRQGGRLQLDCWLFSTLIEKGVLLRSRVLAAVGPADTITWADRLIASFAASPPPLTA